jgi:hypothetical protein
MVAVLGPNEVLPYYIHTYFRGPENFFIYMSVLAIESREVNE